MLNKRLLFAWGLGIPVGYGMTGFLDAYYTTTLEILFVSAIVHTLLSLAIYFLLGKTFRVYRRSRFDAVLSTTLTLAVAAFFIGLVIQASRFSRQFDVAAFIHPPEIFTGFVVGILAAYPIVLWLIPILRRADFRRSHFHQFVDANAGGLVIALLFFAIYFHLAAIFNQPVFDFDDIFFDTDSALYRYRFGTEFYKDYYERTVHPYVLIIVRPWVWLASLIFKGDVLYGAFIVTALTGALCVFLVWYFVRESTSNPLYALLIAGLFGASTSQLAFGSLIENYIFLGAAALIFIVLLMKDKPLYMLVIAGLVSFGITISNIAQTVIAHFMVKRSIPQLIKYGLLVGAFIIPLNLLNNAIYPDAHPYLWEVSTLQFEEKNVFEPTLLRANFMSRVMLLHSFVAPDPLLIKEDIPFLKVWLFRAALKNAPLQIARYETVLGKALVAAWLVFLAAGGVLFLKSLTGISRKRIKHEGSVLSLSKEHKGHEERPLKPFVYFVSLVFKNRRAKNERFVDEALFKPDHRFQFAFILIVLFSFALHMRYGRDVFLYSANWTYAITLFLALAWREISGKRWFQIPLLAFIVLTMLNNARLILFMHLAAYIHIR